MFALHTRMAQVYSDAIHDGLVSRSPLSRRTSPRMGKQRPYVATTEQIWALHDALDPAIGLGCCWRRSPASGWLRYVG